MGPGDLAQVLRCMPEIEDPNVLVGINTGDDAAVYRLRDDLAIVQTVDYFTPIVDDPYDFGQVAAANSLSDVYAMGARPIMALSIVGFPAKKQPLSVMSDILRGGADKAREAGIYIVGGHSIDDAEPKYGLAVTGVVRPDCIYRNVGAEPGDRLVLTKPMGTGIVTTAIKLKKKLVDEPMYRELLTSMAGLNRTASEAMTEVGANACTDVTGFGLLGHLAEMTTGSDVDALVFASRVPLLPGTEGLLRKGMAPGGTERNLDHFGSAVDWDAGISEGMKQILFDPQTSGGLLIAVPGPRSDQLLDTLKAKGCSACTVVGEVVRGAGRIRVVKGD